MQERKKAREGSIIEFSPSAMQEESKPQKAARSPCLPSLVRRLVPSADRMERDTISLTAAMHSLVLDADHPIALEIVGSSTERGFLLRATTSASLAHVSTQLQARYPQAQFLPVEAVSDPLRLDPGETLSAIELLPTAASYLPLSTWESEQGRAGTDPVLGLLAALDDLPEGLRAISQLTLIPASLARSRSRERLAAAHERADYLNRQAIRSSDGAPSLPMLLAGGGVLLLVLLYTHYQSRLPVWVKLALHQLLQGKVPHLSFAQNALVVEGVLACFLVFLLGHLLWLQIRSKIAAPSRYNRRLVEEHTSHIAYQVRLRLYVIGKALPDGAFINQEERSIPPAYDHIIANTVREKWRRGQWQRAQTMQRQEILARLVAAYRQFHLASGNSFVARKLPAAQARRCAWTQPTNATRSVLRAGWSRGIKRSSHLIGVDALAALWHIPPAQVLPDLALVEQRQSRTRLLPSHLAHLASREPESVLLGTSMHAGRQLPFVLPVECLTRHFLIGGKSGEGKSTCMEHLAGAAMRAGGLVLIDPHGDLAEHVLRLVPSHRMDEVVWIDLSERDAAVGFNPLDATLGRGRDKAIADLIKTLSHIWIASWGSRMEIAFEYSLRTLFEANKILCASDPQNGPSRQYTLLDVMPVLTDESFCHALLEQIEDPYLRRWWITYYDPLSLTMQRDRIDPVLSKVAKFESQIARRIIGQGQSTLNFADCIQQEKIVLVNLAKGVVGEDVARILGATLLGLLQTTLEEQGSLIEVARRRLCIMIDEFQTLKGVDWAALAELRKYGAAFHLATQSLDYLHNVQEHLLSTVLANVKQLIIFHMSAQDAQTIHQELDIEAEDIVRLDSYTCYIKLTYQNQRQSTFSATLAPPPPGDAQRAQSIRQQCVARYAVPASDVDALLHASLVRAIAAQPTTKESRNQPSKNKRAYRSAQEIVGSSSGERHRGEECRTSSQPGVQETTSLQGQQGIKYRGRKSQEQRSGKGGKHHQGSAEQSELLPMHWGKTTRLVVGSPEEEGGDHREEKL